MPVADEIKSSWADEVEEVGRREVALPPPSEVIENGYKIVTEYKREDDKKLKIVRTYKIEKRVVSKSIALRKTWHKYGVAENDKPGPNPANTIIAEDVYMLFITSREDQDKPDEDALEKLKSSSDKTVRCRVCSGDHWTLKCPFKDTSLKTIDEKKPLTTTTPASQQSDEKGKKYVPPIMRDGSNKRGEPMSSRRDETAYPIRVSNLSESTQDSDLDELVKPFGPYTKIYLAKDKSTGACKGFAYIHFKNKMDAAKAIENLHGHGYDHLILNADWSKPQNQS